MAVEEFHYRVPWRTKTSHPGHHHSTSAGGGFEFRGHASLLHAPDPRRFDVQASLRDPFEQLIMRLYAQRSSVPVYLIADLSASMGFQGTSRKLDLLAQFTASLSYSAYRTGDPFAFIGCESTVRDDLVQPLTHAKAAGQRIGERLRSLSPADAGSNGLLDALRLLTKARSLIFLCSDFHFPLELLSEILGSMSHHAVVPVVFWDSTEMSLPVSGIAAAVDPETHKHRTLLIRPWFRQRLQSSFGARKQALTDCFMSFGVRPLFLLDRFDAEQVTRYFFE